MSNSFATSSVALIDKEHKLMGSCPVPLNVDFNTLRDAVSKTMEELQRLNGDNTEQIINLKLKLHDLLLQLVEAPFSESELLKLESQDLTAIIDYFNSAYGLVKNSAALLEIEAPSCKLLRIYHIILALPKEKEQQKLLLKKLLSGLETVKLPKILGSRFTQGVSGYLHGLDAQSKSDYLIKFEKLPQVNRIPQIPKANIILKGLSSIIEDIGFVFVKQLKNSLEDDWNNETLLNEAKDNADWVVKKIKADYFSPSEKLLSSLIETIPDYLRKLIAFQKHEEVLSFIDELENLPQADRIISQCELFEIRNEALPKLIESCIGNLESLLSKPFLDEKLAERQCNVLIRNLKSYSLSQKQLPRFFQVIGNYLNSKSLDHKKILIFLDHLEKAKKASLIQENLSQFIDSFLKEKIARRIDFNFNEKAVDSIYFSHMALTHRLSTETDRIENEYLVLQEYISDLLKLINKDKTRLFESDMDIPSTYYSPIGVYRISERLVNLIGLLKEEDKAKRLKEVVDCIVSSVTRHIFVGDDNKAIENESLTKVQKDEPFDMMEIAQRLLINVLFTNAHITPEAVIKQIVKDVLSKYSAKNGDCFKEALGDLDSYQDDFAKFCARIQRLSYGYQNHLKSLFKNKAIQKSERDLVERLHTFISQLLACLPPVSQAPAPLPAQVPVPVQKNTLRKAQRFDPKVAPAANDLPTESKVAAELSSPLPVATLSIETKPTEHEGTVSLPTAETDKTGKSPAELIALRGILRPQASSKAAKSPDPKVHFSETVLARTVDVLVEEFPDGDKVTDVNPSDSERSLRAY